MFGSNLLFLFQLVTVKSNIIQYFEMSCLFLSS